MDIKDFGKGSIAPAASENKDKAGALDGGGFFDNSFLNETPKEENQKQPKATQMTSGDDESKSKFNKDVKKKLIILGCCIAGFAVVFIGINMLGSAKTARRGSSSVTDDLSNTSQLEEIRALKNQIAMLENEKEEAVAQIDAKLDEKMKNYMTSMQEANPQMMAGGNNEQLQELINTNKQLQSDIAQIKRSVAAENEKPKEPKEGSTQSSQIYTTIQQHKEAQAAETARIEAERVAASKVDYDIRQGLQTGQSIKARLDTKIVSSQISDNFYVSATTTEPVEILPGMVLPAGTVFLGKPKADFESRRIGVDIVKMRVGSSELDVKGVLLDKDGCPGLVTKYVDPMNSAMWAAIPLALASATASALKKTTTYYNATTGYTYDGPKFNTENALYQGLGDGLGNIANKYLEMESKKKAVIIVSEGIEVKIQISEKTGLEKLIQAHIVY